MVNFEETFISQPVYIIFYSVANFFLPLAILLTLYSFICKTIWESARYKVEKVEKEVKNMSGEGGIVEKGD